ncbi:hypothetical protein HRJ32_09515 [Streptococcus oralis subsp. oralis]|uniref:hypothetical protein n=1 Tax=Streptococcus oralis TaxID=1303 RepID=UPI0015E5BA40|nr:hypothetical protein [Streptococcus oralis]MBA1352290.1 hypothetical protein [Streptococcus oralis subsp. oralis]
MDIFKIPAFVVAIVSLLAIFNSGKSKDSDTIKRDVLITMLKGMLISLPIVFLNLTYIYFSNSDFKAYESFNGFIIHYGVITFSFVFLSIFIVQLLFPNFDRDIFSLKKYGEGVSIESKSSYDNDFYIEIFYLVKKISHILKLYFLTYIFKLLLFSLISFVLLVSFQIFQNDGEDNPKYPYIADEKIFITNTETIEKTFVQDGEVQKKYLPTGTIFSISKGSHFSIETYPMKEEVFDVGEKIRDGVYGLMVNEKILLSNNTKIYYEGELDHTIFFSNNDEKIVAYYTVKTVPGETYFIIGPEIPFKVMSSSNENPNSYYKFIVGASTEEARLKGFFDKLITLNIWIVLISILIILLLLPKYFYLITWGLFCTGALAYIMFIITDIGKFNLLWSIVSIILIIISVIEMITYGKFLKKNILLKRIKNLDTINVKINKYGAKALLFNRKDENPIDIDITDNKYFYSEQFKYVINGKEQKGELRVIVYDSVKLILSSYFKKYSIITQCIRWIRKFVSKK